VTVAGRSLLLLQPNRRAARSTRLGIVGSSRPTRTRTELKGQKSRPPTRTFPSSSPRPILRGFVDRGHLRILRGQLMHRSESCSRRRRGRRGDNRRSGRSRRLRAELAEYAAARETEGSCTAVVRLPSRRRNQYEQNNGRYCERAPGYGPAGKESSGFARCCAGATPDIH